MMDELNFDIEQDPMKTAAEQADSTMKGIMTKVSKWKSVAVLGALLLITLVLPLASFSFVNPLSIDFVINAVYSLILATTCYYIFAPMSAKSERLESVSYKTISGKWSNLSRQIRREGLLTAFYRFCSARREEEREERKSMYIEAACIPREIYDEKYAGLTVKELKELKRKGELTKSQFNYLKMANGEIKVLPINASMILTGTKMENVNDAGRDRRNKWMATLKPVTLILTMFVRGIIHVMGNTDLSFLDYVTSIMTTVSIVVTWSFAGFRYGISQVRDEEQLMTGRTAFIHLFLEREGVKADDAEEDQKIPAREGGEISQEVV